MRHHVGPTYCTHRKSLVSPYPGYLKPGYLSLRWWCLDFIRTCTHLPELLTCTAVRFFFCCWNAKTSERWRIFAFFYFVLLSKGGVQKPLCVKHADYYKLIVLVDTAGGIFHDVIVRACEGRMVVVGCVHYNSVCVTYCRYEQCVTFYHTYVPVHDRENLFSDFWATQQLCVRSGVVGPTITVVCSNGGIYEFKSITRAQSGNCFLWLRIGCPRILMPKLVLCAP